LGFLWWLVDFELLHQSVEIEWVEAVGPAGFENDGIEAIENFGPLKTDKPLGAFTLVGMFTMRCFSASARAMTRLASETFLRR
jgi:hypothetical protein